MDRNRKESSRRKAEKGSREVRSFLAIPLPEDLLDRVRRLQQELAGSLPGIRWVNPATLHLTLKFFGSVPEESLEKIGLVMLSVGRLFPPFTAEITGVDAFPSPARARVIWLGVAAAPLRALQAAFEEALQRIGIPREERPFTPHLTLGRSRTGSAAGRETLEKYRDFACGFMEVEKVVLFESRLHPAGAVHLPVKTVFLEGETRGAGE